MLLAFARLPAVTPGVVYLRFEYFGVPVSRQTSATDSQEPLNSGEETKESNEKEEKEEKEEKGLQRNDEEQGEDRGRDDLIRRVIANFSLRPRVYLNEPASIHMKYYENLNWGIGFLYISFLYIHSSR